MIGNYVGRLHLFFVRVLASLFFVSLSLSFAASPPATQRVVMPSKTLISPGSSQLAEVRVLIVYYSLTGNIEKMAKAVTQGAEKIPGAKVFVKEVSATTVDDLKKADAIVLGSPTYYGNIAGPLKNFIDDWYLKYSINLNDKVGGAFSTGMDESGGKEHVLHSLVIVMMNAGMVVVGPLEPPFGMAGVSALEPVTEKALKQARDLGEHVAIVARRIKIGSN